MEMADTEKLKRILEQLLGVCGRASPGPWKYREERSDEMGSYGEVNSQAGRKILRGCQSMVFERSWMEDGVFCCDARDYFPSSLRALLKIIEHCQVALKLKGCSVDPQVILDYIQEEWIVDSDRTTTEK